MTSFRERLGALKNLYETRLEPEHFRALAQGYWRTLLIITTVALPCIVAFSVWQFVGVLQNLDTTQGGLSGPPPVALDRSKLQATLSALDEREAAYERAQSAPGTYRDPSR